MQDKNTVEKTAARNKIHFAGSAIQKTIPDGPPLRFISTVVMASVISARVSGSSIKGM